MQIRPVQNRQAQASLLNEFFPPHLACRTRSQNVQYFSIYDWSSLCRYGRPFVCFNGELPYVEKNRKSEERFQLLPAE